MIHYLKHFSIAIGISMAFLPNVQAESEREDLLTDEIEQTPYQQLTHTLNQLIEKDLNQSESEEIDLESAKEEHQLYANLWHLCKVIDGKNQIFYDYALGLLHQYPPIHADEERPYEDINLTLFHLVPNILDQFNPTAADILRRICITYEQMKQDRWFNQGLNKDIFDHQFKNSCNEFSVALLKPALPIATINAPLLPITPQEKQAAQELIDIYKKIFQERLKEINEKSVVHNVENPNNLVSEDTELQAEYQESKNLLNSCRVLDPKNDIFYEYTLKLLDQPEVEYSLYGIILIAKPCESMQETLKFFFPSILNKFNPVAARLLSQIIVLGDQNSQNLLSDNDLETQIKPVITEFLKL